MNHKSLLPWKRLTIPLQTLLPNDHKYTYIIEHFQPISNEHYEGAPTHYFETGIRIDLSNEDQWIEDIMAHSVTTYPIKWSIKPGFKRVQCKLEMHCQNYRKPLTNKQKQARATVSDVCTV